MPTLHDVLHELETRRVPARLVARVRGWALENSPPYRDEPDDRQCAAWVAFLGRYDEWTDDEWLRPDFVLDEWRFQEENLLGTTKENIALGHSADGKFGMLVYRAQELTDTGTRLLDKSLVIRFPVKIKVK